MSLNRAILLTAPGAAAIAVVRIVGPLVEPFLDAHFSRRAQVGRCVHGELRDGESVIDDPIVVLLPNERGADVNLHGGPWVVQAFFHLAQRAGFAIVEDALSDLAAVDGETIIEREIAMALPLAKTELAVRALLGQADAWGAFLDPAPSIDAVRATLEDAALWWLLHPPRVAIVGAANVGKSTLANQLFAQQRSIVADVPGTTRDWVGEIANIDGLAVMLIDTPGVRETTDPIERAAIERAAEQIERADLIVQVLDATRPLLDQPRHRDDRVTVIRVANKVDGQQAWRIPKHADVQTVATSGEGVDRLRGAMRKHFRVDSIDVSKAMWWTPRQRNELRRRLE